MASARPRLATLLNPYEVAERCAVMREQEMSSEEIGQTLGLSKPHVNNLLRLRRQLHPDLREEWKQGILPTDIALKYAALPPDDQIRRWREETGRQRLTVASLRELLTAVERAPMPGEWRRGAVDALRCALRECSLEDVVQPSPRPRGGSWS